jgi:RNA polymerase sigma-70 factor (ECF subfamily)
MAASVKPRTTVSLLPSRGFQRTLPETSRVPYSFVFIATCGVIATSHESARQLPLERMEASHADVWIREGKNTYSGARRDRRRAEADSPRTPRNKPPKREILFMSALQSYASSLRPAVGTRRPGVKIRRRKTERTRSSPPTSPSPRRMAAPSTASERPTLVQQAIDGNSDAHEQIFATHTSKLRGTAFAILRNREDAEDAVQDAFCRAFASLQSFEGRSSFSTWLTRIVINSSLMIRRKRNRHSEASLDEVLDNRPEQLQCKVVDAGPNPEQICASSEIRALVEKQVRQLPPGLQTAFQLYELDDLSGAESMQTLGIGTSAFKSRISRARRKVENGLRQTFHPPANARSTRVVGPSLQATYAKAAEFSGAVLSTACRG